MGHEHGAVSQRSFTLDTTAGTLHCLSWTTGGAGRPTALLSHGTGFCASVWQAVAVDLADRFDVIAVDRRGHGASMKPRDAYDFTDFAADVVDIVDSLGLDGAFGVGHSAGATDLLLAAAQRPAAFERLVVIEPTVMDPSRSVGDAAGTATVDRNTIDRSALEGIMRRQVTFPSRHAVIERYRGRGIFDGWQPELLEAYVDGGFDEQPDGTVTLRCTPSIERSMLTRIFDAMEGSYGGDAFATLGDITCPVLVVTTERSQPVYDGMAAVAVRLVPVGAHEHLDGVGHAVAQVAPRRVAEIARRFWRTPA